MPSDLAGNFEQEFRLSTPRSRVNQNKVRMVRFQRNPSIFGIGYGIVPGDELYWGDTYQSALSAIGFKRFPQDLKYPGVRSAGENRKPVLLGNTDKAVTQRLEQMLTDRLREVLGPPVDDNKSIRPWHTESPNDSRCLFPRLSDNRGARAPPCQLEPHSSHLATNYKVSDAPMLRAPILAGVAELSRKLAGTDTGRRGGKQWDT